MFKVKRSDLEKSDNVVYKSVDEIIAHHIGFWAKNKNDDEFIHPSLLEDYEWDANLKAKVVAFLDNGRNSVSYFGFSRCRICGIRNGCSDKTDGVWLWPEGLAHYVKEHNVILPVNFITYVSGNSSALDPYQNKFDFWNKWCDTMKKGVDI